MDTYFVLDLPHSMSFKTSTSLSKIKFLNSSSVFIFLLFFSLEHLIILKLNNLGHFYGQYTFDLDKTLYFFTAGRREIENKGVDMFIESLAELNHLLKQENSDVTIVAFIIMPGNTNSYNVESIRVCV